MPPGIFTGLDSLTVLTLSHNQVESLPPGLAAVTRLTELSLSHNPLGALPPDLFGGMTSLEHLRLYGMQLTELPPGIFRNLPELRSLNLAGNELQRLDEDVFAGLSGLRTLHLFDNDLADLPPPIFRGLDSLEQLRLNGNQLVRLPPSIFSGPSGLRWLWLAENRISALPAGIFEGLGELRVLKLGLNALTDLPPNIFEGLGELRVLGLRGNALTGLPPGVFEGLHGLVELDLLANALTELPPGAFLGLSALVRLELRANPGAPFPVSLELTRTDTADVLAPAPASVAMRVPIGAPLALEVPVSVQGGSASGGSFKVSAGDTASAPLEVSRLAGRSGAVHLSLGRAPPTGIEVQGLEYVLGGQMALFAPTENRTPVVAREVSRHWLQAGVQPAEVELTGHFSDPDGDTLVYMAASGQEVVVEARVDDGFLVLEPLSEGSAMVDVTAEDPAGLRATLGVPVTVARAPDPEDFFIELIFIEGGTEAERFTESEKASVRRAAARWEEVVAGDLPDVPVDMDFCRGTGRMVGRIDDVVISVLISPAGGLNTIGTAGSCAERESGLTVTGDIWFNRTYYGSNAPETGPNSMYEVGLHEIGHVLGIGLYKWRDMLREPTPHGGVPRDTHFPGSLAVEAFNQAGGRPYTGGKVPVDNGVSVVPNSHWRYEVLRGELMAPKGGGALSAITVQALADLGYEVDASRADPFELPALDVAAAADAGVAEPLFAGDVIQGPVLVVDENGRVVRIIRN